MSVGVNSINRVSKQKNDTTEKDKSAASAKKKTKAVKTSTEKTATEKTLKEQKNESGVENKIYCLTEELPYYLL